MSDQDLAHLYHLLPAAPSSSPSSAEQDQIEARLTHLIEGDRVSRRRRQRLCDAGALAVIAACVASIVAWSALAVGGGTSEPPAGGRPVVASAPAVAALDNAAQAVLTSSAALSSADTGGFAYTRSTVVSNEGGLGEGPILGAPHEREIWLTQDPSPVGDVGLIREFGQDWPIEGGTPVPAGLDRPTYEWLDSLPTDPDRLLAEIEDDVRPVDSDLSRDHVVFTRIGSLIGEGLVPPRVAAALFRAATRIPGVTLIPVASDAIGRQGIGVVHGDDVLRSVWVLDPQTYEVLGIRDYFVTAHGDVLFGASAILERGFSDESGQAPRDGNA